MSVLCGAEARPKPDVVHLQVEPLEQLGNGEDDWMAKAKNSIGLMVTEERYESGRPR
jgi:hypothetical protein